ncbi:ATP synthase subunit g, mitochondrial [Galemys pyrenaicus]|uniref:ATP synthase subunit g, mitochondrial n=1 Tax=Galemys pyrenaicus TaxID=202257 RepID=A0A8J6DXS1_GALPY|nr:ATP synthase subunit g, mitochondrial [Galemys pyrenaicus]
MAQFIRNLAEKALVLVNATVPYLKPQVTTFWNDVPNELVELVELVPPTPAEIPTAIQSLRKIVVLKRVASNGSQLRKLCQTQWPLRCGCASTLARSRANVGSWTTMSEDQS